MESSKKEIKNQLTILKNELEEIVNQIYPGFAFLEELKNKAVDTKKQIQSKTAVYNAELKKMNDELEDLERKISYYSIEDKVSLLIAFVLKREFFNFKQGESMYCLFWRATGDCKLNCVNGNRS